MKLITIFLTILMSQYTLAVNEVQTNVKRAVVLLATENDGAVYQYLDNLSVEQKFIFDSLVLCTMTPHELEKELSQMSGRYAKLFVIYLGCKEESELPENYLRKSLVHYERIKQLIHQFFKKEHCTFFEDSLDLQTENPVFLEQLLTFLR